MLLLYFILFLYFRAGLQCVGKIPPEHACHTSTCFQTLWATSWLQTYLYMLTLYCSQRQ